MADKISAEGYFERALEVVDELRTSQMEKIKEAGRILAERVLDDGVIHVFGTGHSRCFGMEMYNRAGGLAPVNLLSLEDLTTYGGEPPTLLRDPETERYPDTARRILGFHDVRESDAMIIVSNSGRNGSTVEMALAVKERGLPLIVVTSLAHSRQVTSRHPSGKKLYEIGDVVIDNCGPYGDALLEVPGSNVRLASISSITGAFIAQSLTAEIAGYLLERGKPEDLPVLLSANVDGGDAHNQRLMEKYEGRVK